MPVLRLCCQRNEETAKGYNINKTASAATFETRHWRFLQLNVSDGNTGGVVRTASRNY